MTIAFMVEGMLDDDDMAAFAVVAVVQNAAFL